MGAAVGARACGQRLPCIQPSCTTTHRPERVDGHPSAGRDGLGVAPHALPIRAHAPHGGGQGVAGARQRGPQAADDRCELSVAAALHVWGRRRAGAVGVCLQGGGAVCRLSVGIALGPGACASCSIAAAAAAAGVLAGPRRLPSVHIRRPPSQAGAATADAVRGLKSSPGTSLRATSCKTRHTRLIPAPCLVVDVHAVQPKSVDKLSHARGVERRPAVVGGATHRHKHLPGARSERR